MMLWMLLAGCLELRPLVLVPRASCLTPLLYFVLTAGVKGRRGCRSGGAARLGGEVGANPCDSGS